MKIAPHEPGCPFGASGLGIARSAFSVQAAFGCCVTFWRMYE
ncbi:hypothetical protein HMPREF0762_01530 [Slackia exigua ATCC 700122]|uniref:Uncharacterized protein n=1 Tax=Slackia exigua (strain ATCC 700122 / DSM 15923 / CIP 105133 / JCM 11022 / KCTC 5966 / S-7) TaxID=649764 RepID=D0WI59_SLAES|nr:hypothetical protein HMPREF0762_01530 [Slackia exigua ATCC 700122]